MKQLADGSFLLTSPANSNVNFNQPPPPPHEQKRTRLSSDWLKLTRARAERLRRWLFRISIMVCGELNQWGGDGGVGGGGVRNNKKDPGRSFKVFSERSSSNQ